MQKIVVLFFLLSLIFAQEQTLSECKPSRTNFYFYDCELWVSDCEQKYVYHNCSQSYCMEYTKEVKKGNDGSVYEEKYCSKKGKHYYNEQTCIHMCCGNINANTFRNGNVQVCSDKNTEGFVAILKVIGFLVLIVVGCCAIASVMVCVKGIWRWFRRRRSPILFQSEMIASL